MFQWAKKQAADPRHPSPLTLARALWPTAPLTANADDGKAVALHLAALAHQDDAKGIDRRALQDMAAAVTKAKKTKIRQQRRQAKALQF